MAIDVDSSVLWLGSGRDVRVGGGLGGAKKHTIYREIQKFKPPKRSKHTG